MRKLFKLYPVGVTLLVGVVASAVAALHAIATVLVEVLK